MIRLCSYNIHSGVGTDGEQNYRRIGDLLRDHDVDIALLQEMDTRPEERATDQDIYDICAEHFHRLEPSPALREKYGWYGNAIAIRHELMSSRTIDVSHAPYQPRNIQECIVQTDDGPLRVINTHKGLKRRERFYQFDRLCDYLESIDGDDPTPIVLAGDMNEWQFFTKAFKRLNSKLHYHRTKPTFPTFFPIFRLDRTWSRPANIVKRVQVLKTPETRIYSDHYPLLIDISLN